MYKQNYVKLKNTFACSTNPSQSNTALVSVCYYPKAYLICKVIFYTNNTV